MAVNGARAVFLDKDGTLIENVPYNVDPARMTPARGALQAVGELHRAGYEMFVVSNQSGVARGKFGEPAMAAVRARLEALFAEAGARLAAFYHCPHHPEGSELAYAIRCDCRKPAPGMLRRAAREHGVELTASWMVGDILDDIEAGNRAGCRTVLVDNGGETQWRPGFGRTPEHIAPDLRDAARYIASRGMG